MVFDNDNGCLRKVDGSSIAAGMRNFPPAAQGMPPRSTDLKSLDVGWVRISYEPHEFGHRGKSRYWAWGARYAVQIEAPAGVNPV